jgi:hypothetical protein
MENFDTTDGRYDGVINDYLEANKDDQFNLETTAIAASRVFAVPQDSNALAMAQKNPALVKMWSVFQQSNELQKATIDQIIEVQKASHAFIQLINKREMLQAAAIITVKNQLNTLNIENQQIYETIKKLAGNVLERFTQLERKIEHVEAVASLTQWIQNLKWRKYQDDPHAKRFFRILDDFYINSGKNFTLQNLESLKTAFDQSDIEPFKEISLEEFTTNLVDEWIQHDFHESIKYSPYNEKYNFKEINNKITLPFLSSLYLIAEEYNHHMERRYSVDRIRDDIKQAALCYMKKDCGIDVSAKLEYYHLGIELLNGRRLIEFLGSQASAVTAIKSSSTAPSSSSVSSVEIDTSQERYKDYLDTVNYLLNDKETPGVIDDEGREILKMKQEILKLTDEEAQKIEESAIGNLQNKSEAERKYKEEIRNALENNPEITPKKRMRLDLSAQSFGVTPDVAQKCEAEIIEEINKNLSNKIETYRSIVREKLTQDCEISPKARMFLDLKIQELELNKELANKCEKEEWESIELKATKDSSLAARLNLKEAERGDQDAQYRLGNCYYEGTGVPEDKTEAVKWYHKAAEQGHAEAQYWLGHCYSSGTGVPEDKTEAVKWYHKAAEQGNAQAQLSLGEYYFNGVENCINIDETEAVKWFRKAAEQGNANAQFNLGICTLEDESVAKSWLRKAAEQGHVEAQYTLGLLGSGMDSVNWFRKAAEQGYAEAQYRLGELYYLGVGVEEDEKEAFKWYHKAAIQGIPQAQNEVGLFYLLGIAVSENENEAIKWFKKAAEQGLATSQLVLGNQSKTETEKREWYKKIIDRSEIISNENYSCSVNWGFFYDDISIQNISNEDWNESDYFLEVTIKNKQKKSTEFYQLLQVPALTSGEEHQFKDVMSISSGSDENHSITASLYRLNV